MAHGVVGFDLDMTLVDSRPQVLASFRALSRETGVAIDVGEVAGRLGLKLEQELRHWFALADIAGAAAVFRQHYGKLAAQSVIMPGALAALAAVRDAGGSLAIVTGKHRMSVGPCLQAVGIEVDDVFCFVHGPEKADVLRRIGAKVYVGDTPDDMAAAVASGAVAVGVATGSFPESALLSAGAVIALETLEDFPACYRALPTH